MTIDVEPVRRLLERRGYRDTTARRQALEAMARLEDGFTAEELHAALPRVGRATVYRTVKLLVDVGVLCKTAPEDGAPRYRLGPRAHHHHLVCVSCGAIRDFARCNVDKIVERVELAAGYQVFSHRVEMYGLCPRCRGATHVA